MVDLEVCVNSAQSAYLAFQGGAIRVELCQNLNEGGTTPSCGAIRYCVEDLKLRTYVLVRPRGGNFYYSDLEFHIICEEVLHCKSMGVTGVVVGFLNQDLSIDKQRTMEIVRLASPMEVTFHRAFDLCTDWRKGLEDIVACGCTRILTSGGGATAKEGIAVLKRLVMQAQNRVHILPGSGIRAENVASIIEQTGVQEVHASCKHTVGNFQPSTCWDVSNFQHEETDIEEVQKLMQILKKY